MNAPARFTRTALGAFAIVVATACGGHASNPLAPVATSMNRSAMPPAVTISGVIKTDNYVVPAGKTVKVGGNVTIFATDSIEIAGTLEVPRGTEFAFFAPQFTVSGAIASAPALSKKSPSAAVDSIDACSFAVSSNGGIEIPPGDVLAMASTEADCDLTVGGYAGIHLDPVPAPTPFENRQPVNGENGGNIAIGIKAALALLKQRAGSEPFGAFAPRDVNLNAPLTAGIGAGGSNGITRYARGANATCFFDKGGNGGKGGSVSITAQRVNQLGDMSQIVAGGGGAGGGSGYDLTICKVGGTPMVPKGANVFVTESNGGDGGNIAIETSRPGSKIGTQTAGNGGAAGFLTGLYSAPSYCLHPPCSASLSNVELHIGIVGAHGTGGRTKAVDGAYPPLTATILGGEPSTGAGASFTLGYPADLKPPLKGFTITLNGFGIGGSAPSNCGAPGENGAKGGTLHDDGAITSFKIDPYAGPGVPKSFSGGNGGNGTPPGKGGIAGFDDEKHKIGSNGTKGIVC